MRTKNIPYHLILGHQLSYQKHTTYTDIKKKTKKCCGVYLYNKSRFRYAAIKLKSSRQVMSQQLLLTTNCHQPIYCINIH